jgi:hypothetical protein
VTKMAELSKKALKEKLEYWEVKKQQLENHPTVTALLEFEGLPEGKKQHHLDEWNNYFDMARTTEAYRRFKVAKDAYRKGDMARVRDIAKVSRKAMEQNKTELVKPRGIDYEGERNSHEFNLYKQALGKIKSFKNELAQRGESYFLAEEIYG